MNSAKFVNLSYKTAQLLILLVAAASMAAAGAKPKSGKGPTILRQKDVPIVIAAPGSYQLGSNLNVSDPTVTATFVTADNVTIDLAGFTIEGPQAGTGSGINTDVQNNVVVRNGVVRGFFDCVHLPGYNNRVENVRAEVCDQQAIFAGQSSVITGYQVSFSVSGISADHGSIIDKNTLFNNSNIAIGAGGDGGVTVVGNNCRENGTCIRASTNGNRIEDNLITDNGTGLDLGGSDNFFARNFLYGNTMALVGEENDIDGGSNVIAP